ncbi:Mitogen-activated protein kinase 4a [Entophlyctis luteolus]|nr:Mitogen-activated protein kinase 4a [Entophlyctis luteolus]
MVLRFLDSRRPLGSLFGEFDYLQQLADNAQYAQELIALMLESYGVLAQTGKINGFTNLSDYSLLYSTYPNIEAFSVDFSADATFARARVTYSSRFLTLASNISFASQLSSAKFPDQGVSLTSALAAKRIYVVDHSDYANYFSLLQAGRYSAAPTAVFYLTNSGKLTPIAISYGPGQLVVTPSDGWDWTLAKMIFNSADIFKTQFLSHFVESHVAFLPISVASSRKLSASHPVSAMLGAILKDNVGNVLEGVRLLLNPNGLIEWSFSWKAEAVVATMLEGFATYDFNALDPLTDANTRGTINIVDNPAFVASAAHKVALTALFVGLVKNYYPNDAAVIADYELQGFAADIAANSPITGFPTKFSSRNQLAGMLAQLTFLTTVHHHSLNYISFSFQSILPWTPSGIFSPIPTAKGQVTASNIMKWLPSPDVSTLYVLDTYLFRRPFSSPLDSLYNIFRNTTLDNPKNACILADFQIAEDLVSATVNLMADADPILGAWRALDPHLLPNRLEDCFDIEWTQSLQIQYAKYKEG